MQPFETRSYTYYFLQESLPLFRNMLPSDSPFLNGESLSAEHFRVASEQQGFGIGWLTVKEIENQIDKKSWKSPFIHIYTALTGKVIKSKRELLEQTDFFEVLDILNSLGDPDKVRVVFYFM